MAISDSQSEKKRQLTLFGESANARLSIENAAQLAGVSTATIRNWLKTGCLQQAGKGFVTEISLNYFLTEVAGKDKLTTRANKSLKDDHDHATLLLNSFHQLDGEGHNLEEFGANYEASLSDSYRNKEGVYYTPQSVVEDLFRPTGKNISTSTFCDPCCGSGNFIMRALDLGFLPENVHGYDIDPVAVELTKKRIFEKTGYQSEQIVNADFLAQASVSHVISFDYIYTNPPWGKKLPKAEKEYYGDYFEAGKSLDTCSLFFFASLAWLRQGGELGLLLPESFFNITAFEKPRSKSLTLNIKRLIDYEKPFKGLVTKAMALVLENQPAKLNASPISCESKEGRFNRTAESFINNPHSILNLHCRRDQSDIIEHVYSIEHLTLKGKARWGIGIVTGNNKKFAKQKSEPGYLPVIKGADIKKDQLAQPKCYIPEDLTLYQQVASGELFNAEMKLIYKFISSNLCFFCDTKQRYLLNSANMLVPANNFPLTGQQLCSLLNSDFMNWLFRSIFKTHKILRGDLESLPLHTDYFIENAQFNEEAYLEFLQLEKGLNGTYRIKK